MEFAALAGLVAIGAAVSQLASGNTKKPLNATAPTAHREGFRSLGVGIQPQNQPPSDPALPVPSEYYTVGVQAYLTTEESNHVRDLNNRINSAYASGTPEGTQAIKAQIQSILERGSRRRADARGSAGQRAASNTAMAGTELDMMYKSGGPNGAHYASEPGSGSSYGTPLQYGSSVPPLSRRPENSGAGPMPEPIDSATPQIALMSSGVETSSAWIKGDSVVSSLSGQEISASDFKHNNMQPFFRGSAKQNMSATANTSKLDSFTGSGSTQIRKQEIAPLFDHNQPFGQPFGNEPTAEFVRSRIVEPGRRNNELPWEKTRVGPSLGEKGGITGQGGFQQMEVNEIMKRAMPTTDKLRVATNPKLSYNNQVIPGAHFITAPAMDTGEVRKYKPDTFFINESGERNGIATGDIKKETVRPIQVLKYTTRTDTTDEVIGTPASQEAFKSYVAGDYKTPMNQQFGGAGYRNTDASTYGAGARDDYGVTTYEVRPNERLATQDRVMGLNLNPAESGQVAVHYEDDARPTRRGETVGNIRQTGTPVGYAGGAPAITTWDPSDVARTTVKETTVAFDYRGIAGPNGGPERLKVYDPNDVAKPTQKSQLSQDSRMAGPAISVNKDFTSHEAAYNMRKNESKTAVAKLRRPTAGNGKLATFNGDIKQTARRITADDINDRSMAVNRVTGLTPGTADLGRVQYRLPLKLDVSAERNQAIFVDAVENNPLNQSLRKNAIRESMALEQLNGGR